MPDNNWLSRYRKARQQEERERMTHVPFTPMSQEESMNALATALMAVPVAGDVAGFAADVLRPEVGASDYALASLGLLPFVPRVGWSRAVRRSLKSKRHPMSRPVMGTTANMLAKIAESRYGSSPTLARLYEQLMATPAAGYPPVPEALRDLDARLASLPAGGNIRQQRKVDEQRERLIDEMLLKLRNE